MLLVLLLEVTSFNEQMNKQIVGPAEPGSQTRKHIVQRVLLTKNMKLKLTTDHKSEVESIEKLI